MMVCTRTPQLSAGRQQLLMLLLLLAAGGGGGVGASDVLGTCIVTRIFSL